MAQDLAARQRKAESILSGLKSAGIDFVAGLPDDWLSMTLECVRGDPSLMYAPVVNERSGVCVCAGAWLGGKKPAILMEGSGLLLAVEALTRLRPFHIPFLMVMSYRGDLGDGNLFAIPLGESLPRVLQALNIPYLIVRREEDVKSALIGVQQVLEISKQPYAILLGREVVMG